MLKRASISFALLPFVGASAIMAATQPNIVLFLVDDMGAQDTSVPFVSRNGVDVPSNLNSRYVTPNMERLASMGVKFTRAYACPVSSPSRVSLITGSNAARHRVTNWTHFVNSSQDGTSPNLTFQAWNYNAITPAGSGEVLNNAFLANCLPEILKNNGYRTIHVGKAHFGVAGKLAADPTKIGFDVNIAGSADGGPGSYQAADNYSSGTWHISGLDEYQKLGYNLTKALTEAAKKEIDNAKAAGKPFFLYMAHYAVHAPFQNDPDGLAWANQNRAGAYDELSGTAKTYATMISGMDYSLGQLLDKIQNDSELAANTIIMFMSDNGGNPTRIGCGNGSFKEGKGSLYEGGIHEPMMVYTPEMAEGGTKASLRNTVNDSPVIIEDFFPSILEMAGVTNPTTAQTVDGKSFVPALDGSTINQNRDLIFHYPNDWNSNDGTAASPGGRAASAIVSGNWKLIRFYETKTSKLYNLETDISEANDLSATEPEKKAELEAKLTASLKSVEATMPISKTTNIITYPDGSEVDLGLVIGYDAPGILDFTGNKGRGTAVVAPIAPAIAISDSETVSMQTKAGTTLSVSISYSGTIMSTGTGGQFGSLTELANSAAVSTFLGVDASEETRAIWGDGITLERDNSSASVVLRGLVAGTRYRIKVLDLRKNSWYGNSDSGTARFSLGGDIEMRRVGYVGTYANNITGTPTVTRDGSTFLATHTTNNNLPLSCCWIWEFVVPSNFDGTVPVTFTATGKCSLSALSVEEITSAGTPEIPGETVLVDVAQSSLVFDGTANSQNVTVSGAANWTATKAGDWIGIASSGSAGSVGISTTANPTFVTRTGTVLFESDSGKAKILISQASSFASWKNSKFEASAPETETAPDAIPAGDKIINLEKFVFDADGTLEPTKPAGAFGTTEIITDAGVDFLQVEFPYNIDAEAVNLSIERFAGTGWLTDGAEIIRDTTNKKIRVKLTTPISSEIPKQAVRLKGTLDGKTFTTESYGYELIPIYASTTTKFGLCVHKPFIFQKEIPLGTTDLPFEVGTELNVDKVKFTDADLFAKIEAGKSYIVEIITEVEGKRVSAPFIVNRSAWRGFDNTVKDEAAKTVTFDCANLSDYLRVSTNVNAVVGYRIREASTLLDVFGPAAESNLKAGTSRTADIVKYHILDKNLWSFYVDSANKWNSGSLKGENVTTGNAPIFYHRPIQVQRRGTSDISYILTGEVLTEEQKIHVYKNDTNISSGLLFGDSETTISKPTEESDVQINSKL